MKIAVVGATGLVGRSVAELLITREIVDIKNLFLFASKKSAGKTLQIGNDTKTILELNKQNIKKFDYVVFCAGKSVSLLYAKQFVKKGAYVIDNSSAFRRDKNVPLIVPEINFSDIKNHKLIANPNCSTIGASLPLFALLKRYKIKRIIVSTYQAVSGAGQKGINDLINNTSKKFTYPIANNLIPQIDVSLKNGNTYEEDKMEFELKKILKNNQIKISTTCVRVPIFNCHSESINIEFSEKPNLKLISQLIKEMQGVVLFDILQENVYPMPIIANGKNDVYVGRIRKDTSCPYAINMFISFDNILKGASLNAVQIVEKLIEQNKK